MAIFDPASKIPRDPDRLPHEIVRSFVAGVYWMISRRPTAADIQKAAENYAWTGDAENSEGP